MSSTLAVWDSICVLALHISKKESIPRHEVRRYDLTSCIAIPLYVPVICHTLHWGSTPAMEFAGVPGLGLSIVANTRLIGLGAPVFRLRSIVAEPHRCRATTVSLW
jgi:hypothetical protein